ncbi:MAG: type IV pilus modification protein PilV [Spiribacter salinus]|uniref:Type IV pilus modification protein PilV n=1 Tax=Spiribacter salinus TaxID=1335746 RepID=A0A540V7B5_9GAMM|nr:MAG: type IV pilus modification protein PilV [Spiribacter salinus]
MKPLKLKPVFVRPNRPARQRGVTLIEILITLIVLSVGLLGLAALQSFSLQAGQVSLLRTQATNFAYEVADHARANRSIVETSGNVPNTDLWTARAAELLPGGTVAVAVSDMEITVTVTWRDDRENATDADFEITTRI